MKLSLQDQKFVNLCLWASKVWDLLPLSLAFVIFVYVCDSLQEKKLQCQSGSNGSCPIRGAGILQCWKHGILHPMLVEQAQI